MGFPNSFSALHLAIFFYERRHDRNRRAEPDLPSYVRAPSLGSRFWHQGASRHTAGQRPDEADRQGHHSATAARLERQLIEMFPRDTTPHHLLRDLDVSYGADFRSWLEALSIGELLRRPPVLAERFFQTHDQFDPSRLFGSRRDFQRAPLCFHPQE
jgi:hypothetical protein